MRCPTILSTDAVIVGAQEHVRVRLKAGDGKSINAIAFRAGSQPLGQALRAHTGQPMHVAGSLTIDRWGGAERTQLRIIDISPVMGRARAS